MSAAEQRLRWSIYGVCGVAVVAMHVLIEMHVSARYAPEMVLVRPPASESGSVDAQRCIADVSSEEETMHGVPLQALESIYDAIDPRAFLAMNEEGYHLLETGLSDYRGQFEIEIRCSMPGSERFSYMVINNANNRCVFSGNGSTLVC